MRFFAILILFLSFLAADCIAQPGPIEIDKRYTQKPPKNRIGDFKPFDVIFCFDTVLNPTIKVKMLRIKEISIVDVKKGNIVQTIIPRQSHEFFEVHFNEHVQLFDTAQNSDQLAAFRFMVYEQYYTERRYAALKWDHYYFDQKQERYVLDSALSNYFNVQIDTARDSVWRYYITEQPPYKMTTFYALQNGHWEETQTDQTIIEYKPAPKEESNCMRLDNGNFHVLPVVFENEHQLFITRDSFMFWNYCEKNVGIDLAQTSDKYAPNFKIVHTGRKSLQINFEQIIGSRHIEGIGQTTGNYHLKFLGQPQGFTMALKGFRVRNDTKSFTDQHGKIAYFYHERTDSFTQQMLFVDSLMRPTAFGESIRSTGERIGLWNFFDPENQTESYQQFGKLLHIKGGQKPIEEENLEVYSLENGAWVASTFTFKEGLVTMPFREYTDSIKLVINDESCTFKVNFSQWQHGTFLHAYFIKKGDLYYLYQHGMRVALYFAKNAYDIQWNTENIEGGLKEACVHAMSKLFPQIAFLPHPSFDYANTFSFPENMSEKQRQEMLDQMLALPYVSQIAKQTLADLSYHPIGIPSVGIVLDYNTAIADITPWIEAHNFKLSRMYNGYDAQYYNLEYDKPLFDEQMIRDMMALSQHPNILQAIPDFIYKIDFEPINMNHHIQYFGPDRRIEQK